MSCLRRNSVRTGAALAALALGASATAAQQDSAVITAGPGYEAGAVHRASAGDWHTAAGGSVWFNTPLFTVAVEYARGEKDAVYLRLGMGFQRDAGAAQTSR